MVSAKFELFQILKSNLAGLEPQQVVTSLSKQLDKRLVTSTTFALESQVLTHMLLNATPNPRIFFLDTGRMFQETFAAMNASIERFGIKYEYIFPERVKVETMVRDHGPDLFMKNPELRKLCCQVRKVDPMAEILKTCDVWISGLRKEQSPDRADLELVEFDERSDVVKVHPLLNWTTEQVWTYVRAYQLPYNALHDVGFPSIGCAPCTRAVPEGQPLRSGRWWWEVGESQECGIHWRNGRLIRGK